ncbi:MAG: hypothetical protein M1839_005952 [Geoglossum umbratile]|nr:MAG: hypothetical protein M1839_005952 [Geoglossum umbratile]
MPTVLLLPPSPLPHKSSQTFTRKISLHNISEGSGATVPASLAAASMPCPSSSQRAPNISAPVRPSREGTPNVGAENSQDIHIVQSNLTNLAGLQATSHRCQGSFGSNSSLPTARKGSFSGENPLPTNSLARSGGPSRIPSRTPPPSPSQQSSPRATSSLSLRSPDKNKDGKGHSPSKSTSRFGIFSRGPKPNPEPLPTEKPEKPGKKGPTAGTGYEGYGKYLARGRSGSTTSASGSWARSNSASSITGSNIGSASSRKGSNASKNELEADCFFLDRLELVFISGGGSTVESQRSGVNIPGSGGSHDASRQRPSTESKDCSTQISIKSKVSNEISRPNLARLAVPSDPFPKPPLVKEHARSTQGSDNENSTTMPTLAARRSQTRPQLLSGMEPMSIPTPINTFIITRSSSAESTDDSTPVLVPSDPPEDKEASGLKPRKDDKQAKSPRRWNFFQRTQTTAQRPPTVTEVPVAMAWKPPPRQVAHYALLDSGYQDGNDDLGVIMNDIQESTHSERSLDYARSNLYTSELRRQEHVHSILLPDLPSLTPGLWNTRPSSPKVLLRPSMPKILFTVLLRSSPPLSPHPPSGCLFQLFEALRPVHACTALTGRSWKHLFLLILTVPGPTVWCLGFTHIQFWHKWLR